MSHSKVLHLQELRTWMEYAEATYYHMESEETIEKWLHERGWQLLMATFENRPHSPVHYIAVHEKNKQLLVSVRGTESISDAVTDMMSTFPHVSCKPLDRVCGALNACTCTGTRCVHCVSISR
jgi:hypothetical protein